MGAAFGLNDELTAQVVRYFLPPILKSIAKRTETSQGLLYFLEFVGSHHNERYWSDPGVFGHPQIEAEGNAILATLFPNPAHIRKIISNRAKVLPVAAPILELMFPYVAILALGAIEQRTRAPLGEILRRLAHDRVDAASAANPYKPLANEIRRRRLTSKARDATGRGGFAGMFGSLFTTRGSEARSAA